MKKLILSALFLTLLTTFCRAQEAVVIANPSVGDVKLTSEEVKNILLGTKTKWDAGGVLKLAILSEGPVHDKVVKDFTQRTADQFDKHWKKQVFTGKGIMPYVAKSDTEMVDYVAKTPGAVGYVAKDSATGGVKVLTP